MKGDVLGVVDNAVMGHPADGRMKDAGRGGDSRHGGGCREGGCKNERAKMGRKRSVPDSRPRSRFFPLSWPAMPQWFGAARFARFN